MKRPHNRQRIVAMHQMLFEMARGNFNMQVPVSGLDDELETLLVLLNMVAEELKESVLFSSYINPHGSQMRAAPAIFVLDDGDRIANASAGALTLLGYEAAEILGRPIAELVAGGVEEFRLIKDRHSAENNKSGGMGVLHFISGTSLSVKVDCALERLAEGKGWMLGCIAPYMNNDAPAEASTEGSGKKIHHPRRSDVRLVQKVYDYILGHLDEPLPTVKELSRMFGTNEFKLKEGFRHFLHTSIYQFYTDERLKRAYFMIEQSDIPLKSIAQQNGFNSYPNFSKSFKKRFGFSPKDLPRT